MDTDDLSLEAYGIIIKGSEISNFLKIDIVDLVNGSSDEEEFLIGAYSFFNEVRENQQPYLDDWLIDKRFDDTKLYEIMVYIKSIQTIPAENRTYLEHNSLA